MQHNSASEHAVIRTARFIIRQSRVFLGRKRAIVIKKQKSCYRLLSLWLLVVTVVAVSLFLIPLCVGRRPFSIFHEFFG